MPATSSATWVPLHIPDLRGPSAVYDPLRHRVVLFGGGTGFYDQWDDTWALDLTEDGGWRRIASGDHYYLPREEAAAVYDPLRDRMLVIGGGRGTVVDGPPGSACYSLSDVWELPLGGPPAWHLVATAGAVPPRWNDQAAVYDAARERVLVYGGDHRDPEDPYGCGHRALAELWELDLRSAPTWRHVGQTGDLPPAGPGGSLLLVPEGDVMLYYVGGALWSLAVAESARWERVTASGAPPAGGRAVVDAANDRVLVHDKGSVWAFDLASAQWTLVPAEGPSPGELPGCALVWDSREDRLVVFGTTPGTCDARPQTWQLCFDDPPRWSRLEPFEIPGLAGHAAVFDSLGDRLWTWSGWSGELHVVRFGQGVRCIRVDPPGPRPQPRDLPAWAHDTRRNRLIIAGGSGESDTWALWLGDEPRWELLADASHTPLPALSAMIYDPVRDRLLAHRDLSLWEFRLAGERAWQPLVVAGPQPPARFAHRAVYDPPRDRMVASAQWTLVPAEGPSPRGRR